MSLLRQTILPVVTDWAAGREPAWSPVDLDAICVRFIAISEVVTPHLVNDTLLSDAETQQFLFTRARSAIDSWLIRGAAEIRQSLRLGPPVRTKSGQIALGLRAATVAELMAVAGIGPQRAAALARALILHPDIRTMDNLDAVEGIGPATIERLKADAYLDLPQIALVSPTLLAFSLDATTPGYLAVLDRTDHEIFYGDASTLARRPPQGGTAVERFIRLLDLVAADAQRRMTPLAGALASRAKGQLSRQKLHQRYRDALGATDGVLVVNDAYVQAMLDLIGTAENTLRLAVFVATATRNEATGIGSLAIIEALEARITAGVTVRVIVDRDRPRDPYHSSQINRPVIDRLRAAGAQVKQDETDTLLHSKFLVADTSSVIVGSHNLTTSSIAGTHEVSVRLDNTVVADAFAARFDALWAALP